MHIPFDKAFAMLEQGKSLIVQIEGSSYAEVEGVIPPIVGAKANVFYTPEYRTKVTKVIKSDWIEKGQTLRLKSMRPTGLFVNIRDIIFYTKDFLKALPKIEKLKKNKKPTNKRANYVGVEMEMCTKLSDIELTNLLIKNKLDRFCTISGDGSIDTTADHEFDLELKILAKESEIEKVITKVCKILNKDERAVTNDSCGLHVHLDMRNRNVVQAYYNLYDAQDTMETMVDSYRLDNEYCQRNSSKVFAQQLASSSRYKTINVLAYNKFKTLEVRLHEGTTDSKKINKWIKFLLKTVKQKNIKEKAV